MAQEATHPKTDKEKDLAAMGHPKDKITHKDVLIGRGVLKKEEKEEGASKQKETKFHTKLDKLVHKTFGSSPEEMKKEETELSPKQKAIAKLDHPKHKIDGGDLAKLRAGHKPVKEEKESCEDEAEEAVDKHEKKMHGKKGEVKKHENEMHKEDITPFSSLIESYKKKGLKSLSSMKKEEVEQIDELNKDTLKSYVKKATGEAKTARYYGNYGDKDDPKEYSDAYHKLADKRMAGVKKANTRLAKEEVEQIDELNKSTLGSYIKKASHDVAAKGALTRQFANDSEAARKDQNYVGARKSMEKADKTFSKSWKRREGMAKAVDRLTKEDVELDEAKMKGEDPCWDTHEMVGHKMKGGKKVPNCVPKNEEVDSETFKKEMEDQKAKFDGKKKGADVAKASVQAVKQEEVELDERTLTEPETKKKEEVVKSMKKNLQGFKDRYGDRAKNVMYATATKTAKEKA
jgi:hypothetical protein